MEPTLRFRSYLCLPLFLSSIGLGAQSISFVITDESCDIGNDGAVDATVTGGQPPYQFNWSNGATTEDLSNVPAGNYTLTVTDDNSQQWSDVALVDQNVLVINTNNAWSFFYDGNAHLPCPYNCNGQIGIITSLFTNSTPPYQNVDLYNANFDLLPLITVLNDVYIFGGICSNETLELFIVDTNGCGSYDMIPTFGPDPISTPIFTPTAASNGLPNGSVDVDLGVGTATLILEVLDDQNNVIATENSSGGMHTFDNLYAGNYTLRVIYDATQDQCFEDHLFSIPDLSVNGVVEGTVFEDYNSNCIQEPGEPGIPYMILEINPGPEYAITNQNGFYQYVLPYGVYDISQTSAAIEQLCPVNDPENFTVSPGTPLVQMDFSDSSLTDLDIELIHTHGPARPGFAFRQTLVVHNTTPDSTGAISLSFTPDPLLQLDSSSHVYAVNGNEILWTLPAQGAYQVTAVHVFFTLSSSAQIGIPLFNMGTVSCAEPELPLANNNFGEYVVVTGSHDPNDKTSELNGLYILEQDSVIDYMVRFQNTGTDTAFTVVITDTLSSDLDLTTLQIGASSHPFEYTLEPGRVLKFTFNNILLPDSNVNELASHGYVSFKIKPHNGITSGTLIQNVANIYFDFNAPVITDPCEIVVSDLEVKVNVKAFLGGPYDENTGWMTDSLRNNFDIPFAQPYGALGYVPTGVQSNNLYHFSVLFATGQNAVVDWVIVELRDEHDPSVVVRSRYALIQRDGDIVNTNGVDPLNFYLMDPGRYRVAVLHRNHLPIITEEAYLLYASPQPVDLTVGSTAIYGTDARKDVNGVKVLWPGDVSFDQQVKYTGLENDRDPILVEIGGTVATSTTTGYKQEDVNMDGIVKYTGAGNDRDIILQTIGGVVPTAIRNAQWP